MAQTPARDFIKTAVADFRFYEGDARNHANNVNALAWSSNVPLIQPAHGVPALVYCDGGAPQAFMVLAQTAVTIELLISMDMLHLETDGAAASTILLSSGSWNVGLAFAQGAGEAATPHLWASFSGAVFGDTYFIDQPLLAADSIISAHKGAMLHVVLSAEFVAATSLTVTTLVNGVYATATTNDHTNHNMDPTPTNTLLDIASNTTCPVYLLRMWSAYEDDALVLADLYREARKVVPTGSFVPVAASELSLTTVA